MEPLVGAILGIFVLHEVFGRIALAGGALIIGGAVYFSYKPEASGGSHVGMTKPQHIETVNLMSEASMMANRTVQVGVDHAPPAPMQFGNPDTGDFRGYEVDLLEEIGRRAGFRRALWSVIIHELKVGDVDLVCSAATVTPEREREVDFCVPHLRLALAVVKRDGIARDTTIKAPRVGVRLGTTAEAYAKQYGTPDPALVSESNEELYASLAAGELDAIIDDSPIARYFCQSVTGLQFAGVLEGTEGAYAIMVRKGNAELRAEINRAIADMKKDGTQQRLLSKWFGDDQAEESR